MAVKAMMGMKRLVCVTGVSAVLGGCSVIDNLNFDFGNAFNADHFAEFTDPYLFNPAAFNRGHQNFVRPPPDRNIANVCYAAYSSTPEAVFNIANDACGVYGKTAVFIENRRFESQCPLFTPVEAVFACLKPGDPRITCLLKRTTSDVFACLELEDPRIRSLTR